MNDVKVIGLMMTSVLIPDLMMDVPHGTTVSVPADKAARSKDLWRLISQKQLFRLGAQPHADFPHPPPVLPTAEADRLREENRLLSERNRLLEATLASQGGKLDTILDLLASGKLGSTTTIVQAGPLAPGATPNHHEVVDHGVPTYIPAEIKPQNVESHIEVQAETSSGSGVAGAGEALRKLRKKGSDPP